MLVLSEEQIAALRADVESRFEARLRDHMLESWGDNEEMASIEGRAVFTRHLIKEARLFGLESEFDIVAFSTVRMTFGREFENFTHWKFGAILRRTDLESDVKSAQLLMHAEELLATEDSAGRANAGAQGNG